MDSAEKCRGLDPELIISPHYGMVPDHLTDSYFDLFMEACEEEKYFILSCKDLGMTEEEALRVFESKYWFPERAKAQPKEAFLENAVITIHLIYQSF